MAEMAKSGAVKCCVTGAGLAGLATGKALRDRGIAHDCFEMSDRVGGLWSCGNLNGRSAAYRPLHIDTSKGRLQFSDFAAPASLPHYPHHSKVLACLLAYADVFAGWCHPARLPGHRGRA